MKLTLLIILLMMFVSCRDTDGDGVPDRNDDCVEIAGLKEFNGCPDSDEDGIIDEEDNCPFHAGLRQFDGCPDTDNDGVIDIEDRCPYEYGLVSSKGCPDADRDGVIDKEDECPTTPGYSIYNGCPDHDRMQLSASACFEAIQLTQSEIRAALEFLEVGLDETITFRLCEITSEYIIGRREYLRKSSELQNQIDSGFIYDILKVSFGNTLEQKLIVKKANLYYLMEVGSGGECTMGSMIFNHRTTDWQRVMVRESPEELKYRVYRMRIIIAGPDINFLKMLMENR